MSEIEEKKKKNEHEFNKKILPKDDTASFCRTYTYLINHSGEPGWHENQITQPGSWALLLYADEEGHLAQLPQANQFHRHLQHNFRLLFVHPWMENHAVIRPGHPEGATQGFELVTGPHVQDPAVFPAAEKQEAGGGVQVRPVLGPGARGQGVLLQRLPPRRGLQVGPTGPVGVFALGAAQAELPPAGVVEGQDELPPGAAHLAAAAQVREGKVGQDNPPQLHGEAAHLHASGAGREGSLENRQRACAVEATGRRSCQPLHNNTNARPLRRVADVHESWPTPHASDTGKQFHLVTNTERQTAAAPKTHK